MSRKYRRLDVELRTWGDPTNFRTDGKMTEGARCVSIPRFTKGVLAWGVVVCPGLTEPCRFSIQVAVGHAAPHASLQGGATRRGGDGSGPRVLGGLRVFSVAADRASAASGRPGGAACHWGPRVSLGGSSAPEHVGACRAWLSSRRGSFDATGGRSSPSSRRARAARSTLPLAHPRAPPFTNGGARDRREQAKA